MHCLFPWAVLVRFPKAERWSHSSVFIPWVLVCCDRSGQGSFCVFTALRQSPLGEISHFLSEPRSMPSTHTRPLPVNALPQLFPLPFLSLQREKQLVCGLSSSQNLGIGHGEPETERRDSLEKMEKADSKTSLEYLFYYVSFLGEKIN